MKWANFPAPARVQNTDAKGFDAVAPGGRPGRPFKKTLQIDKGWAGL